MRSSILPQTDFAAAALAALSGCVTDDPDYGDRPRGQYGGGQVEIPLAYPPPAGACERLRRRLPPGAALVRG